ncbi:MAG: hypothetical protein Q8R57_12425 [Bacteroidota bacterium]|nr:hypothetical protein [Bacteroidota bacterium]
MILLWGCNHPQNKKEEVSLNTFVIQNIDTSFYKNICYGGGRPKLRDSIEIKSINTKIYYFYGECELTGNSDRGQDFLIIKNLSNNSYLYNPLVDYINFPIDAQYYYHFEPLSVINSYLNGLSNVSEKTLDTLFEFYTNKINPLNKVFEKGYIYYYTKEYVRGYLHFLTKETAYKILDNQYNNPELIYFKKYKELNNRKKLLSKIDFNNSRVGFRQGLFWCYVNLNTENKTNAPYRNKNLSKHFVLIKI